MLKRKMRIRTRMRMAEFATMIHRRANVQSVPAIRRQAEVGYIATTDCDRFARCKPGGTHLPPGGHRLIEARRFKRKQTFRRSMFSAAKRFARAQPRPGPTPTKMAVSRVLTTDLRRQDPLFLNRDKLRDTRDRQPAR